MSIADQLDAAHSSWKSYQENLPLVGADRVNNSDGVFVDTNDLTVLSNPKPTASRVIALYAVKHCLRRRRFDPGAETQVTSRPDRR